MRKLATLTGVAALAAAFTLAPAGAPRVVQAGNLTCNQTLTANATLHEDIGPCAAQGLIIGANNVVVDLNGFTLSGTGTTASVDVGVNDDGFNNVKVKNGTIDGFASAFRAVNVEKIKLSHLVILGERAYHAVDIIDSEKFQIKDSSITVIGAAGFEEGMRLESVNDVKVENVDVHGGFIGVNFACGDCDGSEDPTNGVIKQSTFTGNVIGILIANSTDALVKANHVSDTVDLQAADNPFGNFIIGSKGISVDSDFGAGNTVSGVVIKENHVHDSESIGIRVKAAGGSTTSDITVDGNLVHDNGSDGILLVDADDSEITENLVNDNDGRGIALTTGSTNNDITDNGATGNPDDDMFHDGPSTGNTWDGNTCDFSSGVEVDCGV